MIESFSVCNFRNLHIESLRFKRINILVGPNNSGKSNLIDAISFFSNLVLSEKKESAFWDELAKRGWDDILDRKADKPGRVSMKWVVGPPQQNQLSKITYELEFQVGSMIPKDFYITSEKLRYDEPLPGKNKPYEFINCHTKVPGKGRFSVREKANKRLTTVTLDVSQYDSVFRQLRTLLENDQFRMTFYPNFNEVAQTVQDYFSKFCAYASTKFNLALVRESVTTETGEKYLSSSGSNFVNVLSYLDQNYDFLYDKYSSVLSEVIHDLNRVKIFDLSDRKRELWLFVNELRFKLSEMSDGTIKALLFALLLWSPERMTILSLDEPELNMHPAWLRVLSNWVLRSNSADQIFISTHSPDFMDGLTSAFLKGDIGLFVFNLDDNQSVKEILPSHLKESMDDGWELGDLYRVGDPYLGGWPW